MDIRVVDCPKLGFERRVEVAMSLLLLHPEDLAFISHAIVQAIFAINDVKEGVHTISDPKGLDSFIVCGVGKQAVEVLRNRVANLKQ